MVPWLMLSEHDLFSLPICSRIHLTRLDVFMLFTIFGIIYLLYPIFLCLCNWLKTYAIRSMLLARHLWKLKKSSCWHWRVSAFQMMRKWRQVLQNRRWILCLSWLIRQKMTSKSWEQKKLWLGSKPIVLPAETIWWVHLGISWRYEFFLWKSIIIGYDYIYMCLELTLELFSLDVSDPSISAEGNQLASNFSVVFP